MPHNFYPFDRDQQYRMPISLKDWLPEDHRTWFVLDTLKEVD